MSVANTSPDGKGHGLLCPSCRIDLIMSERQGIEIDYCPKCRGVWLDRGELDKIIERSAGEEGARQKQQPSQQAPEQPYPAGDRYESGHRWGHGGHKGGHGHGYRRGSFLERLFD